MNRNLAERIVLELRRQGYATLQEMGYTSSESHVWKTATVLTREHILEGMFYLYIKVYIGPFPMIYDDYFSQVELNHGRDAIGVDLHVFDVKMPVGVCNRDPESPEEYMDCLNIQVENWLKAKGVYFQYLLSTPYTPCLRSPRILAPMSTKDPTDREE